MDALDVVRKRLLAFAFTQPALAFVLQRRARRIEARVAFTIVLALALSIFAPAFMLAVGPIVFGVPHVASEVRYLVVRRGLDRRWLVAIVAMCACVAALRVAGQATDEPLFTRIEVLGGVAFVLGGAALGGNMRRLLVVAPIFALGAILAATHATFMRLFFVHAHNFGALVLWMFFFRKRRNVPWLVLALLAVSIVLVLSGATMRWASSMGSLSSFGVSVQDVAAWLTPGFAASVTVPLALLHAFSDSVHYTMWLGVIPEEETRAEGSLTFRMTAKKLKSDFGATGIAIVTVAFAVVLALAAWRLPTARVAYYSLAGFHGYLELAFVAYLFTRRAPVAATP